MIFMNGHDFSFEREEYLNDERTSIFYYKCSKCGKEIGFNIRAFNIKTYDIPENIGQYVDVCEVEG